MDKLNTLLMNRRNSIRLFLSSSTIFLLDKMWSMNDLGNMTSEGSRYIYFSPIGKNKSATPETKRIPFFWKASGLDLQVPYRFKSDRKLRKNEKQQGAWLRIAVAIDVREEKKVEARIAKKNILLGVFDIRFSPVLYTYQIYIKPEYTEDLTKHGIVLKLQDGTSSLWIFTETGRVKQNIFKPHLYIEPQSSQNKVSNFLEKLASLNSLQPFGWQEGCVMDALYQISKHKGSKEALSALHQHIAMFVKGEDFIHENGRSQPYDNKINGIESTLPFAIISQILESHPIFDKVIDFWKTRENEDGVVTDGTDITAEGCYTVAYPMAVMGVTRNDKSLIELAATQLLARSRKLVYDGDIYLRYYTDSSKRTFKNWARGMTWYALGFVRTMEVIEPHYDIIDLRKEFERTISFLISFQNNDGLWSCFIDRPEVAVDTSGSSGIAAAIASGVKLGYLDDSLLENAKKTWNGLQDYLTSDGLLTGIAQGNRNGEEFQASDYRVISQMGMGLMGQLYAYL